MGEAPSPVVGVGEDGQGKLHGRDIKAKPKAIIQVNVCVCVGVEPGRTFQEAKGCKCLERAHKLEEIQDI